MKLKNKLLIFITSLIMIIITLVSTVSKAESLSFDQVKEKGSAAVSNTVNGIYFSNVIDRKDVYCVQHNSSLNGPVNYTVDRYVTIDGNTATNDVGQSVEAIENGALAYILNKGEGYGTATLNSTTNKYENRQYSTTQKALYGISNSWYDAVGQYLSANMSYAKNDDYKDEAFITEAKNYANNIGDGEGAEEATDNTIKDDVSVSGYSSNNIGYIRVGPFNWTFNGSIDTVEVLGDNDTSISEVWFSRFEGEEEIFHTSTEITSGQDFYITVRADSGITKIGKIKVTNKVTTTSTIYTANIWFLKTTKKQNLILAETGTKPVEPLSANAEFSYDIKLTKDLTIEKVDSRDKKIKLEGVGFKLQNKETSKYVHKKEGLITYVDDVEKATEFITDKDGKIEINGLIIGTYLAYETKNPNYGYKQIDGSIEIAVTTSKEVISNEQIYVKLSGYVWQDVQSTKATKRNDLYKTNSSDYSDSEDKAFNGIVVRLKDNEGNVIKETTTREVGKNGGLYSEIDGGEYIFNDVLIEQLANYYVEFEYDGLIYQSVKLHTNKDTGSKATDREDREVLDKNFASVNSTGKNEVDVKDENNQTQYSIKYTNTDDYVSKIKDSSDCTVHAKTRDESEKYNYDLSKLFKAGTTEIKYINLGLYEKAQADLSLTQDLYNVNVGVNGYWHIYKYSKRTLTDNNYDKSDENTWNIGVKFKNSYTGTYKRAIYKSDLNYESSDKNKELQVYLTYKIALTNESSYLTKVNSVVDYFDNRYTLVGVGTGLDASNNITGNINYTTPTKYNDNYQKCTINVNAVEEATIKSGQSNYIYVQFKLERSAVLQIINNKETVSNITEINSYTVYQDDKGEKTVAAVDRDSVPGNATVGKVETYEDDIDSAPSIQLELANARKIAGTVFVDSTSGELLTGKRRQGNGIFDNGETAIEGVEVILHELNNSISDMTTTTDSNGNFEFSEYIPGKYTITYTWGNKTYTVQNYKGTVYDSTRNQNNEYWYKDAVDTRKTDAIDNYNTRVAIDNEMAKITNNTIHDKITAAYNSESSEITITKMDSTTPTMEFRVEYDDDDLNNISEGIDAVKFEVKNVDFGIVERARQQLDMTKRVDSFKITLANGQVLVNATVDENGNLGGVHNYVTYMGPSVSNGYSDSGFIKAEIDNELIEGATLEVGYEFKFINNSELDYMSEDYYKYGKIKGNVVTLTPSGVVDYLDKDLSFEQEKNTQWKQITVDDLKTLNAVKFGDEEFLNSRIILYTESTATPLAPTKTISANLNVSKLLATSSDLAFNNDAETVTIKKPTDETQQRGSVIKYFPADDAEEVEITPSTGDDRNYVLPITIGMMSLFVLGAGVFVIKKFVIDNK